MVRPGARVGAGLLFAFGLFLCDIARADEPVDAVPVLLNVQIVYGSNSITPAHTDPECADIKRRLPMPFSTLKMLGKQKMKLTFGQVGRLRLPTGRIIELRPISVVRNHLHLQFEMQGLVNTRLQMRSGVPVIVGGEAHEGGQIIVMLMPSFAAYLHERPIEAPRGPRVHRVSQPR